MAGDTRAAGKDLPVAAEAPPDARSAADGTIEALPTGDGDPNPDPAVERGRPSIAERAARRDELQATGRDRYGALLRSLQAGHELPIRRRGGRITVNWHPVLWTLVRLAVVVVLAYAAIRLGTQWWRENHVDTWSGPDAAVQSGVRLSSCPIADSIRVDEFPSWVRWNGVVYRYIGLRTPYVGPETVGYTQTPYANGSMHLVTIENTPDGQARTVVLLWDEGAIAGVQYLKTPECSSG